MVISDFLCGSRIRSLFKFNAADDGASEGIADRAKEFDAHPSSEHALRLTLTDDHRSLLLAVVDGGDGTGAVLFDAHQIDDLIAILSSKRSEMDPIVPIDSPVGANPAILADHLHMEVDAFSGKIKLSFRSPGLGWLTIHVSDAQLEAIRAKYAQIRSHLIEPPSLGQ